MRIKQFSTNSQANDAHELLSLTLRWNHTTIPN